jgi:hypothetical protein
MHQAAGCHRRSPQLRNPILRPDSNHVSRFRCYIEVLLEASNSS